MIFPWIGKGVRLTFDPMDWFMFNKGPMNYSERDRRQAESAKEVEQLIHDLEQERAAHAALVEGKGGAGMALKPEVRELMEYMERYPVLYHEMQLHFQKFKAAVRELPEPGQS